MKLEIYLRPPETGCNGEMRDGDYDQGAPGWGSKTRLSPPLSQEEAANISRCFLKDTTAAIDALSHKDPFVVGIAIYTPVGSEADFAESATAKLQNHRSA